ncbi:amino acid adenylation domain-containing protein [Paenibacillus sp. SYP-B3998]|uniref:Amino acid adenylation domain-containing protein n=2 Tax=Paenibacillus sp. SYP-B3998 TaxID=2678564 RepID=A0A6G3ZUC3_9BACL|nr:amino acid adenylation domain-containing protein [Paenibacillus sp. SYP-B3998]
MNSAFVQVSFEPSHYRSMLDFTDQVCIPSLLTVAWSVLLSHYANQYKVPVLYTVLPPIKQQDLPITRFPLEMDIHSEDDLITVTNKIKILLDEGKQDGDNRDNVWSSRDQGYRLEIEIEKEKADFFNIGVFEAHDKEWLLTVDASCEYVNSTDFYQPDIAFWFHYDVNTLEGIVQYDSNHFEESWINQLVGHFRVVLANVLKYPQKPVLMHPLVTEAELEPTTMRWQDTEEPYSAIKPFYQMVEEQAERTPAAIALEFQQQKITYCELNHRANLVGRNVLETYRSTEDVDVKPNTIIAIVMERSADVLPSILGVMKAGAAYLPVDPRYPDERIRFILEDAQAGLIITQSKLLEKLYRIAPHIPRQSILCVDDMFAQPSGMIENLGIYAKPNDLAYVIYTSGSTGKPKGVLIEHVGVTALIPYLVKKFRITAESRVMQFASISFDASVLEWIATLAVGGIVVVLSDEEHPPHMDVSDVILEKNIHIAVLLPSILRTMNKQKLPSLQTIICCGEACTSDIVSRWGADYRLLNAYGPTEVTIICSVGHCQPGKRVTIGSPVDYKQLFVLNPFGNPAPIGVPGELWVGGIGLARGYLNRGELTKERFVDRDIVMKEGHPPQTIRLYRTGDIVKWTPSKELAFIGRNDDQIKIRGFRIEYGEIEHCLHQYPGIVQCMVRAWQDGAFQKLVAYYTAREELASANLAHHLSSVLPDYMIPSFYIQMDILPLNTNGKVDRHALPLPNQIGSDKITFVSKREQGEGTEEHDAESKLLRIWRDMLKQEHIGVNDHFFAAGGDSILAIQMVSLAREQGLAVTPRLVAEYPTVKKLSAVVIWEERKDKHEEAIDMVGEFGLTPIQHWFFEQRFQASNYFNQSQLISLHPCDIDRLEVAFERLLQLHPELTMEVIPRDMSYVQRYRMNVVEARIATYTLHGVEEPEQEIRKICGKWHSALNYEAGEMLYAGVIKGHPDGKDRLFVAIHHLVIDGVSWRILLKDLYQLYCGVEPPPVSSSYKKWQAALMIYAQQERALEHRDYWIEKQTKSTSFVLPVDAYLNKLSDNAYEQHVAKLSRNDTQRLLKQCARAYHTQINDLLLTAWSLALSKWSGQSTVAFRLEGHGREHVVADMDLTRTVGWFTSMYPVCIEIAEQGTLGETIQSVKEQLRAIPDRGISYGALRYCHPDEAIRSTLTGSYPQAVFNYLGQFENQEEASERDSWTSFTRETAQDDISPLNHATSLLELNSSVVHEELHLFMKYSSQHYEESTIAHFMGLFFSHLQQIIDHCSQKVDETFTPSDFPMASLVQKQLDRILPMYHTRYGLESILPLSPLQRGLLFHHLDNPSSDQYFVQVSWTYRSYSGLDLKRYREAWGKLIQENDCLRTCYVWENAEAPIQFVVQRTELDWTELDWSALSKDQQKDRINQWFIQDRARCFDLAKPNPYRLAFIRISSEAWRVVWSYHHILLDGWSMPLLLNRLHDIYCGSRGYTPPYHQLQSFQTYIQWLQLKDRTDAESFWKSYLADVTEPTPVPMEIIAANPEAHKAIVSQQSETLFIEQSTARIMKAWVKRKGITLNTLVQFAWGKLLQTYQDTDITVFGMVVSGRGTDLLQADRITGLLINTLPLVMRWDSERTIVEYLEELHVTIHQLNDYCHVGLSELRNWSSVQGNTLFHSIVAFENYLSDYRQPSGELEFIDVEEYEKTNYPVTITISDEEDGITIKFIYDADRLEPDTIGRLAQQLQNVMHFAMENPERSIRDVVVLHGDESDKLVYDWNRTFTSYPRNSSIPDLFEEQVNLQPDRTALVGYDRTLSYSELDQISQHIAHLLVELGVFREKLIGVYLPRSLEFITAILGVVKAGCAYVPIDPDYPMERVAEILRDAALDTVITSRLCADDNIKALDGMNLIVVEDDNVREMRKGAAGNFLPPVCDQLAYVMYTSGSTGKPKGVMVEHRNVVRLVKNTNYFPFNPKIRMLYTGSPVFDASTFEIWGTLLNGGSLYIVPKDELLTVNLLAQRMNKWEINSLWLSSSLCNQWIEASESLFAKLHWLLVGGDVLSTKHINRIKQVNPCLSIVNGYGPTENTTFSTSYQVEDTLQNAIPIGKPISNSTCYILDKWGRVQPIGAVGELYVGGDGVARGYWLQDDMTREKFIQNVYASDEDREKGRNQVLYRTGDRAKWLQDGNIAFIGRVDDQLKIRGYRIEPREIELHLKAYLTIKECLVLVRNLHDDKQLVAYYTSDQIESEEQLRAHMTSSVPAYMVPSRFVRLASFPLTINGKIDRKRLPLPLQRQRERDSDSRTKTVLEQTIETLWCDVLKIPHIRMDEGFYTLGGNSLHALRIASLLHKSGYPVTVNQIFREQTIENLARAISGNAYPSLTTVQPEACSEALLPTYPYDGFPLSAVQKRFFKRDLLNRNRFNVPYIGLLKAFITQRAMKQGLTALINKHAALRLTFAELKNSEWYQYEQEVDLERVFAYIHLEEVKEQHDTFISNYCAELQDEFDIRKGPLWKAVLIDGYLGRRQQVLLVLFHHLIFDGISMNIFLDDLKKLLLQRNETDLALDGGKESSYRDWCQALTQYAMKGVTAKSSDYWREVVEEDRSLQVDMMSDIRPTHRHMVTSSGDLLEGEASMSFLHTYAAEQHTTPLALLLVALSMTCYDLKNQTGLLMHLMSHQRESFLPNISIDRTIGFFAGAYPVRIYAGEQDFINRHYGSLLENVKQTLQHIPMEGMDYFVLQHMLPEFHDGSESLEDASHMLFHYMSQETNRLSDPFYQPLSVHYGDTNSPDNPSAYWLNMTVTLNPDRLQLTCYFSSLHYEVDTIAKLMRLFSQHLHRLIRFHECTFATEGSLQV